MRSGRRRARPCVSQRGINPGPSGCSTSFGSRCSRSARCALLADELNLRATAEATIGLLRDRFRDAWLSKLLDMSPEETEEFCKQNNAHEATLSALQRNLKRIARQAYVVPKAEFSTVDEMLAIFERKGHVVEKNGVRIGFLGYTTTLPVGFAATAERPGVNAIQAYTAYQPKVNLFEYPGTGPQVVTWTDPVHLKRMQDDIAAFRRQVDVLIVYVHWGTSMSPQVHDFQREIARVAIDAAIGIEHVHGDLEVREGFGATSRAKRGLVKSRRDAIAAIGDAAIAKQGAAALVL